MNTSNSYFGYFKWQNLAILGLLQLNYAVPTKHNENSQSSLTVVLRCHILQSCREGLCCSCEEPKELSLCAQKAFDLPVREYRMFWFCPSLYITVTFFFTE